MIYVIYIYIYKRLKKIKKIICMTQKHFNSEKKDKLNFVKLSTLLINKDSHKQYTTLTTLAVVWAL